MVSSLIRRLRAPPSIQCAQCWWQTSSMELLKYRHFPFFLRSHFSCNLVLSKFHHIIAIMPFIKRSPGIKALCGQLGYNEDKDSTRHYTCLSTPLRQFRSLHKAYDVPRCALEFCDRNEKVKQFFATSSRGARRNRWPILPDDKDRYCTLPCPDTIIPLTIAIVSSKHS